jgi:hypothetical protein
VTHIWMQMSALSLRFPLELGWYVSSRAKHIHNHSHQNDVQNEPLDSTVWSLRNSLFCRQDLCLDLQSHSRLESREFRRFQRIRYECLSLTMEGAIESVSFHWGAILWENPYRWNNHSEALPFIFESNVRLPPPPTPPSVTKRLLPTGLTN